MPVRVSITYHRLSRSDWIDQDVRRRAARLGRYCRLLDACRIVIDVPHRHHVQGNRFRLHVELAVPDEAIAVTRDAPLEASARDLALVIREAFDVARRRLQDYARRHRRAVKRHSLPAARRKATERRGVSARGGKAA